MSLPNWFYPIIAIWLICVPGFHRDAECESSRRSAWIMLMDTLFLLPWVLNLGLDEPIAAWMGLEVLGLVLLFDLLWRKPHAALREAWIKLSISWFLGWLLIGTAVALAGVHPIVENLFYPLPLLEVDRMRPVLAGVLFLIGLCLKLGLPPFQQGVIDLMDVVDIESHRRWALQMRWAIAFSAWQLMPSLLGGLSSSNQQLLGSVLLLGCLCAWLVAGVQAGVQRTMGYLGSFLAVPPLLNFLFIDSRLGLESLQTSLVWALTLIGFVLLGWVYAAWPEAVPLETNLLWTDAATPCSVPGWFSRLRLWMCWCVVSSLGLSGLAFSQRHWWVGSLLVLLALAAITACVKQLGIAMWKQQQNLRN